MEFPVSKTARDVYAFTLPLHNHEKSAGERMHTVRLLVQKIHEAAKPRKDATRNNTVPGQSFQGKLLTANISAAGLNALVLIHYAQHAVCRSFAAQKNPQVFSQALQYIEKRLGQKTASDIFARFNADFPDAENYQKNAQTHNGGDAYTVEKILLLHKICENPACKPFFVLFDGEKAVHSVYYTKLKSVFADFFKTQPRFEPFSNDLLTMLDEPFYASPHSLKGQLEYIKQHWKAILGEQLTLILSALDTIAEEKKPAWAAPLNGAPPMSAYTYDSLQCEYERFSPDCEWMPRVVLLAKTVLVWLDQLSKKYGRTITHLDHIPDEELDTLERRGFTGLWLIGLWERSQASKRIKQINGNAEAAASAYSLYDYDIAHSLGGWEALNNLRERLRRRGIRLAADMIPNHTGMDSKWMSEKPDLFMQSSYCPFPSYSFTGENLSSDPNLEIVLEDHYYSKTDCAVVFKRTDKRNGNVRYIYHGNDGTGMPWNDTAQIDFLKPQAREEVIQKILHVARNFSIIRLDAAMVLAKKHIRRLWYPEPGKGGDIAGRAEHSLSNEAFEKTLPNEFWREVVDRVAAEVPDTLLLAEAFWMMEGYFVRTLGMHRVYNSAFMNMLKKEENFKYRSTIKNTLEFDPEVLKRFVNFMNNPDEDTACAQFGKGDKYFGVCTMMVTMPGLPLFGHGQIEGFSEKYGMEFTKAYRNESEDTELIERHNKEIFPLIKKRYLFAGIKNFRFYDVWENGTVNENVFAYTNCFENEKTAVFYNNSFQQAAGSVHRSCRYAAQQSEDPVQRELKNQCFAEALGLTNDKNAYCIFQEQKTGLWFIRSNAQLFKQGLFIKLNGFEYQELLKIYEVFDTDGTYASLNGFLNGTGCEDIQKTLREFVLKDLYRALNNFASKEFFESISSLCTPYLKTVKNPQTQLTKLFETIKKDAYAYFLTLHTFIEGDYGAQTVLGELGGSALSKTSKQKTDLAWNNFRLRIEALVGFCTHASSVLTKNGSTDRGSFYSAAGGGFQHSAGKNAAHDNDLFATHLYRSITERPFIPHIISAYCILHSITDIAEHHTSGAQTNKLIRMWNLERKMSDILAVYGCPIQDTLIRFEQFMEAALLAEMTLNARTIDSAVYGFVCNLIQSPASAVVLGVNTFGGVEWFNREKALEMTWASCVLYTLFYARPSSFVRIHRVWNTVEKIIEQSGYKTEKLTELLKIAHKVLSHDLR
ncbi:alpha-amylase family glycosyl hydrolase [Treponema lecithinolyticum]|uniref:alpha-amylase family glycosyl hydrolase n=1 Tax=Treponema lecithinolyticum TaxID=53418 RepID=UPI0028E77E43|nr:alpha-amylase family glycosyl hydrolase [Treponema lecithinolyticum]